MGLAPRLVTYPELATKLLPYVVGYKWGRETIHDLWIKGAPMPNDGCPGKVACRAFPECQHIRRVLLPNYFAEWWTDVSKRIGKDISAETILRNI